MSAAIVNNILGQVNNLPQHVALATKKLLFLKLEMELNSNRGVIDGKILDMNFPEVMDVMECSQN